MVVAALIEFLIRGPLRNRGSADLATPYVASMRLARGQNPYDSADFISDWHAAGAETTLSLDASGQRPIYPPTTLVLFRPLTLIRWNRAFFLYRWLCSGAYITLIIAFAQIAGDGWGSPTRLCFVCYAFMLAPMQTAIALGNPSAVAFLLASIGLYLCWRDKELTAGILIALSFCIKPTSAVGAVVAIALYRRFFAGTAFLCTTAIVALQATVSIYKFGNIWWSDYQRNVAFLFGPQGAASFTGSGRYYLINLQPLAFTVLGDARFANYLAYAVTGLLALLWAVVCYLPTRLLRWNWLSVSSLQLLALLPMYQRNYNGMIIVLFAACILGMRDVSRWLWIAAAAVGIPFLFPGTAMLERHASTGGPNSHVFLAAFLMPSLTWAVLCSILLACAIAVQSRRADTANI